MSASMAGGSAAAKARELRAKAARLEEEARQWDKGAEGERRTAAVLSGLAERGYVVLDDLSIPGSKANIDHVVIGPTGVVVVETKVYTGRLNVSNGVLWHGRYPLRKELAAATFEADKVRDVVATTGWQVDVRSLMCIHGVDVPTDPTGALAPVELCGPLDLLAHIESAPVRLEPQHVAHLVGLVEETLPPLRIPAPPTPPARPSFAPALRTTRADAVVVPLRRRQRTRPTTKQGARVTAAINSGIRKLAVVAASILVALVGLALLAAVAQATIEAIGNSVVSTTTSTSTTATLPLTGAPSGEAPPAP